MRWLAVCYTVVLVVGTLICTLIGSLSQYGAYTSPGCNLYDALIYGVRCQGFIGASVVSAIANFTLAVVQLSAASFASPMAAPFAIALWLPAVYAAYLGIKWLSRPSKAAQS